MPVFNKPNFPQQVLRARMQMFQYLQDDGFAIDDKTGLDTSLTAMNESNSIQKINIMLADDSKTLTQSVFNFRAVKPTIINEETGETVEETIHVAHYFKSAFKKNTFIENVQAYFSDMPEEHKKYTKLVVIVMNKINDSILETLYNLYMKFEEYVTVFTIDELQFNIKEMFHCSRMTKLTDQEKQQLYDEYSLDDDKLVTINMMDPAAKAIFLRPGEVVRIDRRMSTAGRDINYQICVNNIS